MSASEQNNRAARELVCVARASLLLRSSWYERPMVHSLPIIVALIVLLASGGAFAQPASPGDERQNVASTAGSAAETERGSTVAAEPDVVPPVAAGAQPDRSRNQAIARTLLLLMGGGTSRPFPLIPK